MRREGAPEVLFRPPGSTLPTLVSTLVFDRGVSFDAACALLEARGQKASADGFYESRRPMYGRPSCVPVHSRVGRGCSVLKKG